MDRSSPDWKFRRDEYLDLTPDLAREFLKRNTRNRNPNHAKVAELALEMTAGNWHESNDDICFDWNGTLLNGQHRCLACIKSGITLANVLGKYGLDPACMETMDNGRRRTCGDKLSIGGYQNAHRLSSCAKVWLHYQMGDLALGAVFSDSEVLEAAKARSEIFQEAIKLSRSIERTVRINPSVCDALLAISLEHDKASTEVFVNGVVTGVNLQKGDPALTF